MKSKIKENTLVPYPVELPFPVPILDQTTEKKILKSTRKKLQVERMKIADMYNQLQKIHNQINESLRTCPVEQRPIINSPKDAYDLVFPFLSSLEHEELWVILLNRKNAVTQIVKLYQGSVNSSQVRVGEVFRQALIEQSSAIILAHNHPSGDPTPSPDDVAVTRAIVQAGKLLDVDFLDHVVIGLEGKWISLKERGLGFN